MNWMKITKSLFTTRMPGQREGERGQVLPMVAIMMTALLGMVGLTTDAGRAYISYRQLQNASDAAALAGAWTLPSSSASSTATTYGATTGNKNSYSGVSSITITTSLKCLTTLAAQGLACASPSNANAVQVVETAIVPTYFTRVFGVSSVTVKTVSTAAMAGGNTVPYNVAVILDGTLSVASTDDNCGSGVTEMNCELQGVQIFLQNLLPCAPQANGNDTCVVTGGQAANSIDRVALFTFPALTIGTYAIDTNCTTPITSAAARSYGYTKSSTYGYYSMQPQTAWSGIPTAASYSFPTAGAASYLYSTLTSTYQITPYLSDYRTSNSAATLNPTSLLSKATGATSGCGAMLAPNYDGDMGTYYAGAIYAAQASLATQQLLNPGSQNVMVLLSDGDATAPQTFNDGNGTVVTPMPSPATSNGTYPSYKNMCAQAVTAAQYATGQGTRVYAIAYGAESTGCTSDASGITPCQTMQKIASTSAYFFSDYAQSGSGVDTGCVGTGASTTNLQQIFKAVYTSLGSAHLILNNTQ